MSEIQPELKLHINERKKSELDCANERIAELERSLSVLRRAHFAQTGTQNEANRLFERRLIELEQALRYKTESVPQVQILSSSRQ